MLHMHMHTHVNLTSVNSTVSIDVKHHLSTLTRLYYEDELCAVTYQMHTSPGRIQLSKEQDPYRYSTNASCNEMYNTVYSEAQLIS